MTDDGQDFGVLVSLAQVTFTEELKAHMYDAGYVGFTTRVGFVLRLLLEEPLSLRGLADRLHMSPQATLKLVDGMTVAGFVDRSPSHLDRRLRLVSVSDSGRAALEEARRFHGRLEEELAAEIGPTAARGLRRGLAVLANRAPVAVPGGRQSS